MKIKRSSKFMPGSALQVANLSTAIAQHDEVEIGSCGHPLKGRPLFMVGKYDICFSCYEERQREIESFLPVEAAVNVKKYPADLVAELLKPETDSDMESLYFNGWNDAINAAVEKLRNA